MIELTILVFTVIVGSAICAGTEAALFSISALKVQQLAQSKEKRALALLWICENMNRAIVTIVIVNNFFNILGSIFIGKIAAEVLGNAWLGVFSGVLTFLIVIFSEIIPKTIGDRYTEQISLCVAIPVKNLTFLFIPLVWILEKVTLPFTSEEQKLTADESEIKFLTKLGFQQGVIEGDEAEMINRVFRLNDLKASDIMTPRVTTTYLSGDATLAEAKEKIIASTHTRMLIIGESIDNVLGIALKDDLLIAMLEGKSDEKIVNLARKVHFVPETLRTDRLLKAFQSSHEHLAVVLDKYGGVAGVVTLEDVIEVLTGEIVDETDRTVNLRKIAIRNRTKLLTVKGFEASVPAIQA
ncbi:hemolysin family protein [Oscillatoria salina]|uniref:hemolysin family protein n=1 Tax=Oscillatoria salina TaxID=331517 RepID=UPI001CCC791E|nr:hemolysin family protein [Oscillatoria salina]MBZ8180042.1 HlyC/CorC family transporter [Oscillatoria salina IIICB1]